ncbi:unnamed protein product [Symbiodinium pilosum]|uniref:Uncharacterized protein n=1 Tax=Symbiodinium pilosum TaxID=2952 RepID=A0A812R762_SYMPI|nr:unnamed protein product [Symbiodinium pilosum]
MKKFVKVPYVRHGDPTKKVRNERQKWGLSIQKLFSMKQLALIRFLQKDKILPKYKQCPHCGEKSLTSLQYSNIKGIYAYRCTKKKCMKRTQPHDHHRIFTSGRGNRVTSLVMQVANLFCAILLSMVQTHLLLDVDDKIIARIYTNLDIARASFVVQKEKDITYGNWKDVEADEVDLGKGTFENHSSPLLSTRWEQWGGLVERGRSTSLRLFRLNPKNAKKRAPGPGPIRKRDWKPIAKKHLEGKNVILHTDGARAYKMKLSQVIWEKPRYTKIYKLKLPTGQKLTVKSGTQERVPKMNTHT